MRIEHLHKSISQMQVDELITFISNMRNRRRIVELKPVKKTAYSKKGKKQPKELDLFSLSTTLKQTDKDRLLNELLKLMED